MRLEYNDQQNLCVRRYIIFINKDTTRIRVSKTQEGIKY